MKSATPRSQMSLLTVRGKMNWQVYIILCSDNSFYTGITTDIERRFRQHAPPPNANIKWYFKFALQKELLHAMARKKLYWTNSVPTEYNSDESARGDKSRWDFCARQC